MLRRSGRWLVVYLAVITAVAMLFAKLPKAFLPDEDQGTMFVLVSTPVGSTQEMTQRALDDVASYLLKG